MKVLLAGASGAIGVPLTRRLVANDHEVLGLTRCRAGQAYNIVDDRPATWREVFIAMADAFGVPRPRDLPPWLVRLVAPYIASFALDTSMHVSNAKARAELGWRPVYPTYREGIEAMVAAHARIAGGD